MANPNCVQFLDKQFKIILMYSLIMFSILIFSPHVCETCLCSVFFHEMHSFKAKGVKVWTPLNIEAVVFKLFFCNNSGSSTSQRVHPWVHSAFPVQTEGVGVAGTSHACHPRLLGAPPQLCAPQRRPGYLHHLQVPDAHECIFTCIPQSMHTISLKIVKQFHLFRNFENLIPDAPELIHDFLVNEKDASCKRNAFMMLIHADQVSSVLESTCSYL